MLECQKLAGDLGHAPSRAFLLNLCYGFRMLGDVMRMKTLATSARSLSLTEGFGFWVLVADIILAWASAQEAADPRVAAERIDVSRKLLHDGGTYIVEPEFASMHAEVLLLAHRPEEATRILNDAVTIVQRDRQQHGEPELYRLLGEAAKAMGRTGEALTFFRRGIAAAQAMGARLLELRAVLGLARLCDSGEVRAELSRVLDGFDDGLDQPDCKEALALLSSGG